jgi:hypothetical protein
VGGNGSKAKPVEVVNPDPIPVEVQEPLQVEIVGGSEAPQTKIARTVVRDAYGALVGTVPGDFNPSSSSVRVVVDADGLEVAINAQQLRLSGTVSIFPLPYFESEDCSGEPVPNQYSSGPGGFYRAASVESLGGTLRYFADPSDLTTFNAQSRLETRDQGWCESKSDSVSWTPPDQCCRRRPAEFLYGETVEFEMGTFTPPFRVVNEISP